MIATWDSAFTPTSLRLLIEHQFLDYGCFKYGTEVSPTDVIRLAVIFGLDVQKPVSFYIVFSK